MAVRKDIAEAKRRVSHGNKGNPKAFDDHATELTKPDTIYGDGGDISIHDDLNEVSSDRDNHRVVYITSGDVGALCRFTDM